MTDLIPFLQKNALELFADIAFDTRKILLNQTNNKSFKLFILFEDNAFFITREFNEEKYSIEYCKYSNNINIHISDFYIKQFFGNSGYSIECLRHLFKKVMD